MRALILSVMLLLGSMPFLFGARDFVAPAKARAPCCDLVGPLAPGTADQWWDFSRTLTGTFIGAALAFLANLHLQRRARRLDQIAAANAAGAVIARMYNGYINVKKVLKEEFELREREAPQAPMWLTARPILHQLRSDLAIDFNSLAFIFQIRDTDTFEKLHTAQAAYDDLMGNIAQFNELCAKKQERMEASGHIDSVVTLQQMERAVGPRIIAMLEPLVEVLHQRSQSDGEIYLDASHGLHRAVARQFGPGIPVIRVIGER